MNNLTDVMQYWLQGQINDAVAGHSCRITYLEDRISSLSERLVKLEKAYPDMATTKDLQKDTDPSVLADKMHEYIEQVVDGKLDGYARRCDLEEDVTAILGGRTQDSDADQRDAQRYRWLRQQRWHDGTVAVVRYSENSVRIGTLCYSEGALDEMIDKQLEK